ncbi:MAG: hypothetical protein KBT27_04435 [Prevotellaceae bacterium]|nr:hypothetical protein [Candidatus Faecinaster equi]
MGGHIRLTSISIDASSSCIGWSIFDDDELVDYGKLTPNNECNGYREKIIDLIPQLHKIMKQYMPTMAYVEDVPLSASGGIKTAIILGAVQGAILGITSSHNIKTHFISVATWRKNIGLFDGTKEGKERAVLKQHSVEKANELFGLDLVYKSPSSKFNDDDISDSILLYASTRDKYKVKHTFPNKRK